MRSQDTFRYLAQRAAELSGSSWAFILAFLFLIGWAIAGPLCHFSDAWQLVCNTVTSVVTFLFVFLIQNTQNRDSKALHLKVDELIRAVEGAHTGIVDLENLSDQELARLQAEFQRLAERKRGDCADLVQTIEEELQEEIAKDEAA